MRALFLVPTEAVDHDLPREDEAGHQRQGVEELVRLHVRHTEPEVVTEEGVDREHRGEDGESPAVRKPPALHPDPCYPRKKTSPYLFLRAPLGISKLELPCKRTKRKAVKAEAA